ncbi:Imm64 family immunity protein [Bacillus sinesaloumensis]|uniref:Imm64 family immunity protein n=1 Tax=Litchfieldia sinesaloumensis TaxID=1926280 RepID=UPI000988826F|nr:Imm64 family immunity protein [Bacillus sinesaloumensis]
MTGGYVNIGVVFNEDYPLISTFEKLKEFILKKGGTFLNLKYSEDIEGEKWVENEVQNNKLDVSFLDGYYISSELSGDIFNIKSESITLTVEKEANYHGFLFSIGWEDIFPDESDDSSIKTARQSIIKTLFELHKTIPFSYSFVGHEIEIEMDPNEFSSQIENNHSYPVAMVDTQSGLDIYYGSIGIDGFSKEIPRKETISN